MRDLGIVALCIFAFLANAYGEERLFSGPQVGEDIVAFEAQTVFGKEAGNKVNAIKGTNDSPLLLIFVHRVTRPSIALTRLLIEYAATKQKAGLESRLVFLTEDPTETEAWFRRARRALPKGTSPMISLDGIEGPGAYGLNRKMTITALVANKGKVTANFPLIQPSIQADAPKIGHAIVKALGGSKAPTLKEMGFVGRKMNMRKRMAAGMASPEQEGVYRRMMSPVIQKTATAEEVAAAAKKVEDFAAKTPWFKARVHKASNMIVSSGKLSNYGTAEAQACLKKWAKEFATASKKKETLTEESAKATTSEAEAK